MATTRAKRHVHKYYKVDMNGVEVWACGHPDCSHYMPDHMKNLIPGKASICWDCGRQFILGAQNMNMRRPLCNVCNPNVGSELDNIIEHIDARKL